MTKSLRRFWVPVIAMAVLAACDDGTDPAPTADVAVQAYVDMNASGTFDSGDEAIEGATVTLTSVADAEEEMTATTDAEGMAMFEGVEVGTYTATIADVPGGMTLASASSPTVMVEADGTASAEFRYNYNVGAIDGTVYRDDDDSGAFDEGDATAEEISISLYAGTSAEGDVLETTSTDGEGYYLFDDLAPGDYTVAVDESGSITFANPTQTVTVMPDDTATADFEFEGSLLLSIAEARELEVGATVAVEGVVTSGNTGESALATSSIFMQDATAGISVFLSGLAADLELGDSIRVAGARSEFNGVQQITAASVEELGTGTVPEARTITAADLNAGLYQGELGTATVTVDSIDGSNVWVSDPSGEDMVIYLDSDSDLDASTAFTVGESYVVTGIISRYNDLFELIPRSPSDVEPVIDEGSAVTFTEARAAAEGDVVTVTGVMGAGLGVFSTTTGYAQDDGAGIALYFPDGGGDLVTGDSVVIEGIRGAFNQEVQLEVVSVVDLGAGTAPTPITVAAEDIEAGLYQGQVVVLDDVTVTAVDGSNVTVEDATGTTTVYIDSTTEIDTASELVVGETYDIAGIAARYNDLMEVKPRGSADITAGGA